MNVTQLSDYQRRGMLRRLGLLLLAVTLVVSMSPAVTSVAYAEDAASEQQAVDSAQATLDDAQAQLETIAKEHEAIQKEADDLQARIDETSKQVLAAQQEVLQGREAVGKTAVYQYRSGSAESLINLFLEAQSFDDLLRNVTYLGSILDYQSEEVAAQQQRTEEFEAVAAELDEQKDAYEEKLTELENKQTEAQQVVADASAKLESAQEDLSERLAELDRIAKEMAAKEAAQEAEIAANANTIDRADVNTGTVQDSGNTGTTTGSGWSTGVASAYGGSSDPYTPNPGTTATGAVCDDWSMGVAVPMAWSNYRSYFGRTVEISYNGMTVYATVNDCGGMGGGSRSLDLQPGVFKAFGFQTCQAWGLRTVSYRFL